MSLRDEANADPNLRRRTGYTSSLNRLIESLDDDTRADVLDLLTGEPWLPHVVVARKLVSTFPDSPLAQLADPILAVNKWRMQRGIVLR